MRILLIMLAILNISLSTISAQSKVDLRLLQVANQVEQSCFDMEIRSPYRESIDLAGQNYRVFYDAENANVIKESIKNYTSEESYGALEVIVSEQNDIGFLSLSVDGRALNDHTTTIPSDGSWIKVASVCFKNTSNDPYDIVWANDRTSQFASAQVALSMWDGVDHQSVLEANLMIDHLGNPFTSGDSNLDVSVYPNPVVDQMKVKIAAENPNAMTLLIKDVIGREVAMEKVSALSEYSYDLSKWPSGRYTVELLDTNGGVLQSQSIIKAYDHQ